MAQQSGRLFSQSGFISGQLSGQETRLPTHFAAAFGKGCVYQGPSPVSNLLFLIFPLGGGEVKESHLLSSTWIFIVSDVWLKALTALLLMLSFYCGFINRCCC